MVTTSDIVQVTVAATNNSLVNTEKVGSGNNAKIFSPGSINLKVSPDPVNILNIYTMGFEQNKKLTISVISVSGIIIKISIESNYANECFFIEARGLLFKSLSGEKILYTRFVKM